MAQHKDSIRSYRLTWRSLEGDQAHHAYTDTITSALQLMDGLRAVARYLAAPGVSDFQLYSWDAQARGYTLVAG